MKLSDLSDEEWFNRLMRRRTNQRQAIQSWWEYYEGEQPLYYVAKILAEQDDRFPPLVINWCEKFVDSIDRRCNVENFGFVGDDSIDDQMQSIWLRNELDENQSANNVASLVTGVSYALLGPSAEGARITIEEPDSMAVEIDPATNRVVAGLKGWSSDVDSVIEDRAVLLLPSPTGGSRLVEYEYGKPVGEKMQKWMAAASKSQTSPEIPIVPFLNRARKRQGRSELRTLKPIVDGANQFATNMMASGEHHAVPRKWAVGVSKDSFTDENGAALPAWKIATGAVWMNPYDRENPNAEVKLGQFSASDLRNFHETLALLARIGSGLCDMSPHTFGFGVSDNPASADGIRASQDDFIGRVERVMSSRGSGYERMQRIALAIEGVNLPTGRLIKTTFRNPATPTKASLADAAVKTYSAGITDLYQARLDYGYTPVQIKAMEKREREMAADPFRVAAQVPDGVADTAADSD